MRWTTFERLVRFSLGASLIIHEGFVRSAAQPALLAAALGLLGLPDLVRFDLWRKGNTDAPPTPPARPEAEEGA